MRRLNKIQFRRRRKNRTDYVARAKLLLSGVPRLIVRRSNRYLIVQVVQSEVAQDKVIFTANSKELLKYGWPKTKSIKNIAAGYLLGALCAVKAKKYKISRVIADLGLQRSTKGNRLHAVIKGAADNGLDIKYSKDIVPPKERLEGEKLKTKVNVQEIREKILK